MDKFIFGITGATGSGKSTVSEIFRKLGVYVADADKAARCVTERGSACLREIADAFGEGVIFEDFSLNRPALADIVFNDSEKLQILNNITHKYIKERLERKIEEADSEISAIDGAVIIGSPVSAMCRLLVVVTADTDIRLKRIMSRDGIDEKQGIARIDAQMSSAQYEQYADFIIVNNGDSLELEKGVEDIYSKIKNIQKAAGTQSAPPQKT